MSSKPITLRKLIKNPDTLKTIKHTELLSNLTVTHDKDLKAIGIDNNLKLSKKEIKHHRKYISSWPNRWELIKNIITYN
jgi:hypothetical protein